MGAEITTADVLVNSIRIAALIYSDMVIFPLPYVTQVKPHLAANLRKALNHPALKVIWYQPAYSDILIWALVMEAIAATKTKSRSWFVYRVIDLLDGRGIGDWNKFLSLVKGFLWWDFVCDIPANKLWDDILEEKEANRAECDLAAKISIEEEYIGWDKYIKTCSTAMGSELDLNSWSGWDSENFEGHEASARMYRSLLTLTDGRCKRYDLRVFRWMAGKILCQGSCVALSWIANLPHRPLQLCCFIPCCIPCCIFLAFSTSFTDSC